MQEASPRMSRNDEVQDAGLPPSPEAPSRRPRPSGAVRRGMRHRGRSVASARTKAPLACLLKWFSARARPSGPSVTTRTYADGCAGGTGPSATYASERMSSTKAELSREAPGDGIRPHPPQRREARAARRRPRAGRTGMRSSAPTGPNGAEWISACAPSHRRAGGIERCGVERVVEHARVAVDRGQRRRRAQVGVDGCLGGLRRRRASAPAAPTPGRRTVRPARRSSPRARR